jgi:hypothetical protein
MPRVRRRLGWYEAYPEVTAAIPTGHDDESHRVSWRRGRLVLHDHDVAAEEVLTALGGERCECLHLLDALQGKVDRELGRVQYRRGSGVYGPGAVQPGQSRPLPGQLRAAMLQLRNASPQQRQALFRQLTGHHPVPQELTSIFDAATALRNERFLRGGRGVSSAPARPSPAEALEAAVVPALERAIRESHPPLRAHAPISIGCWKDVPGEPAVLQGSLTSRGGFIAVSLPVRWLIRVWCRGMAVIDAHFVLDVDAPAPATELGGHVLEWQKQLGGHAIPTARACGITRRDGAWRLVLEQARD